MQLLGKKKLEKWKSLNVVLLSMLPLNKSRIIVMEINHLISSSIGHFCAWHSEILLPHTNLISFVQRGYVSQPCIKDQSEMTIRYGVLKNSRPNSTKEKIEIIFSVSRTFRGPNGKLHLHHL